MKLTAAVLAAAAIFAGAGVTAHADPRPRGAMRARFDINGDGRLDPAERTALRAYIYARLIRRFDLDHDGRLGADEVPPKIAMRLRRFDRNGDGWIEPSELIVPMRRSRRAAPTPAQQ
jgi:hypothetical protein